MSMLSSDIARWKSGAISSLVTLPVSTSMITRVIIATIGIARERVLPRAKHRVAAVDRRLDEVHVADLPLVLLLRRDLLAVRRPRQRRARARRPAGVARRVAEVLRAVGRELALLAGGDVAHPEIPVADEDGLRAVRRHRRRRRAGQPGDVGPARLRDRDAAAPAAAAATAAAAPAASARAARRLRAGAPAGGVATTSRVFFTGSMTTFSVPVDVVRTYQKRPSGSQFASTVPPTTSPLRAGASIFDRAVVVGGRDHAPALREGDGRADQGEDENAGDRAGHEALLDGSDCGWEGLERQIAPNPSQCEYPKGAQSCSGRRTSSGWRALLRTPAFFVTSVGTLALAIGAVAGMFNVVNTVLLRPLPFPDADRLVVLAGTAPGSDLPERFGLGFDFYFHYKEHSKLIDGIFAFGGGTSTLRTDDRVERIPMAWPTNDMYATLGVRPQLGRLPVPEDGDRVVVISDRLWSHLVRPRSVGDRQVVTSCRARCARSSASCRRSSASRPTTRCSGSRATRALSAGSAGQLGVPLVARMKPGVTREQLAAELTQLSKELPARFGGPPAYARFIGQHQRRRRPAARPPRRSDVRDVAVGAARRGGGRAADRVRQRRQPVPGARRGAPARPGRAPRHRRLARRSSSRLQMAEAFLVALPAGVLAVAAQRR